VVLGLQLEIETMRLPKSVVNRMHVIYDAGITCFSDGYVVDSATKTKTHFAYLCDSVTQAQRDILVADCPDVVFRTSSPQYAPEIKRVAICYPLKQKARVGC
jgi:hypothetical protein